MSTTPRIVPGAPSPVPLSKSQLKKQRRAAAASTQSNAPSDEGETDFNSAALTQDLGAKENAGGAPADDIKLSPIVDLISKRLKATNKKITKVTTYASIDPTTLNDDQKATLKTLPALEAVQKELTEIKKAVQAHEVELKQTVTATKNYSAKAQAARVAEAVRESKAASRKRTLDIINLLRLFNSLSQGNAGVHLEEHEAAAVGVVSRALFGGHSSTQQAVIDGLHSGTGNFEGTTFSLLLELADQFGKQIPEVHKMNGDQSQDHVAGSIPETKAPSKGAISFMQADELDAQEPQESPTSQPTTNGEANVHPLPSQETAPEADPAGSWADDEGGLPSLSGLEESFKAPDPTATVEAQVPPPTDAPADGEGEDGFTQARGRGGRGGRRGGHRGGGYRNGERGRGGNRGGHRRRDGDGEHRGRGRGRGRGGPPRGQTTA